MNARIILLCCTNMESLSPDREECGQMFGSFSEKTNQIFSRIDNSPNNKLTSLERL